MQFYSTRNKSLGVSFEEAIFQGLAADKGLYMPFSLPATYEKLGNSPTLFNIAENLLTPFLAETFSHEETEQIISESFNIDIPLIPITPGIIICELFHGPTMAFKDFGARFMAAVMSRLISKKKRQITILVATSGDTGGAVASGFYKKENIRVVILYPKGKVSTLQEKQLTTWGGNISSVCVDGSFDDCQRLVKTAFADQELKSKVDLSTANSINIGRLLPQMIYYGFSSHQVYREYKLNPVVVVPSGNFGNLTAGLFAQRMGYPVHSFIAATNSNDVVPQYLATGKYVTRTSVRTLSNAMDVGSPSNMERIEDLFDHSAEKIKLGVQAISCTDEQTEYTMREALHRHGYMCDPHTAVGIYAAKKADEHNSSIRLVMSTAHIAKFREEAERILETKLELPTQLSELLNKKSVKKDIGNEYDQLKSFLLNH